MNTTFIQFLQTLVGTLVLFTANDGVGATTGTIISVDTDGRVVISVDGLSRTYQASNVTYLRAL